MMAAVLPMSNLLTHCLKVSLLLSSQCSDDQTLKITCESFIQPVTIESTLITVIMTGSTQQYVQYTKNRVSFLKLIV